MIATSVVEQAIKFSCLAALRNHKTRYELVLTNGIDTYLVCFTSRKSQRGIFDAYLDHKRRKAIHKITGNIIPFAQKLKDTEKWPAGQWRMAFTGRTQRECILGNEHPFIGRDAAPVPQSL